MRFLLRHFVLLTAIIACASYVAVYAFRLADAPIRSDGFSYYVYLPSWLLYGDPSLDAVARDCCGGRFPDFTAIRRWPGTGHWINPHPIGVAVQMLPFFATADALTWWSNLPRDGFSLYYQYFAGLAGVAYALGGLWVLRRLLTAHFEERVVVATLVTITWGTNLFHYAVFDSTFSHVYSFFLITLLLSLTDTWRRAPTWLGSVALGIAAGLIVMTRHPNAVFLLLVPLYGLDASKDLLSASKRLWARRAHVAVVVGTAAICITPQLAIYRRASGHWLVNAYNPLGVGLDLMAPHIAGVLFSVQKGLFFWSPVLVLSVFGLFVARGWARSLVPSLAIVMALETYLIASWRLWSFGGSYGHRAFTDALGLFAIPIAAFFTWASGRSARIARSVAAGTTLAVGLSVFQMVQYWKGMIPLDNTTWDQYRAIFLRWP